MTLRFSPPRGAARWLVAFSLPALLAACAGSGAGSLLSPAPVAQGDASATAAPASPAAPGRAAPAGRSAQGAPAPDTQSLTPEQINAECWMSIENNKKVRDLDQRLKLVDKCVEERSKAK